MVIGIDVAADRLNYVEVSDNGNVLDGGVCAADDLVHLTARASQATVVAIDAPRQLSTEPHLRDRFLRGEKFRRARCAEVALGRKYRIWVPWTSPVKAPSHGWISTGLDLYEHLKACTGAELIEVYPHAVFRTLTTTGSLAKKTSAAGINQRAQALYNADLGVDLNPALWSHDSLDAAAAAIVALDHVHQKAVPVGCGHDDSIIWLPRAASRKLMPTSGYLDVPMPAGFDLEGFDPRTGKWWHWGTLSAEWFSRAEDGAYICTDHGGSPIYIRAVSIDTAGVVEHVDGDGYGDIHHYRLVPAGVPPHPYSAAG